ncbi:hypothetical protein ACIB24_01395 [Spongisporangium articulatum]|uniref:Uncharacterized protein n=1 Tax=Spongisporangium articulatum TaxID=3362603 RepID=A0ABW8AH81_9ACTN
MSFAVGPDGGPGYSGPEGYTYAAVLLDAGSASRASVLPVLASLRFSGWVAPDGEDWLVVVPASVPGACAARRAGVVEVAAALAARLGGAVVAVRVVSDRQLLLVGWRDGEELGRYLSDPSYGLGPDDDTLPEPYGVSLAPELATACGRPDAADALTAELSHDIDPEHFIESERLGRILGLLGWPEWLVSVSSLPRRVPLGPASFLRLGYGRPGWVGFGLGLVAGVVRRRRPPPPAVTDAPRATQMIDPWLM